MPNIIPSQRSDGFPNSGARNGGKKSFDRAEAQKILDKRSRVVDFGGFSGELASKCLETVLDNECSIYFGFKYGGRVLSIKLYAGDKAYQEECEDSLDLDEVFRSIITIMDNLSPKGRKSNE